MERTRHSRVRCRSKPHRRAAATAASPPDEDRIVKTRQRRRRIRDLLAPWQGTEEGIKFPSPGRLSSRAPAFDHSITARPITAPSRAGSCYGRNSQCHAGAHFPLPLLQQRGTSKAAGDVSHCLRSRAFEIRTLGQPRPGGARTAPGR